MTKYNLPIMIFMFLLAIVYFHLAPSMKKEKYTKLKHIEPITNSGELEELITQYLKVYDCDDFRLKKEYKWIIPNNFFNNGKTPAVVVYEKTYDKNIIPYFEKTFGYQGLFRDHKEINRFITQCLAKEDVPKLRIKPSVSYTFEEYMEMLDLRDKDVILKMDVFKDDYDTFQSSWEYISSCICLILDLEIFRGVSEFFEKLNEKFYLVHIHLNNCEKSNVIELKSEKVKGQISGKMRLVYIKKDIVQCKKLKDFVVIPSELDTPNCIGEDLILQYKQE